MFSFLTLVVGVFVGHRFDSVVMTVWNWLVAKFTAVENKIVPPAAK